MLGRDTDNVDGPFLASRGGSFLASAEDPELHRETNVSPNDAGSSSG
jgi:hypothetical protein